MLYESVADLGLRIEGYNLEVQEGETSSDFTRATTVVSLHGGGETGRGEDVTYRNEAHHELKCAEPEFPVKGEFTLDGFSDRLSEIDLFHGEEPEEAIFRNYRRWAFESAALDLALRQAETNLAARLDRSYDPVRFVVSTRLEEPPTGDRVLDWLERDPDLEFKLDPISGWTEETVERLAATDAVRVLDLKGMYEGTDVDQSADPELYELLIQGFPEAIVEDPDLSDDVRNLFDGHEDRVSWDYPIRSVDTVESLPWEPDWLNIKPSRFGTVRSVFGCIEYCLENEIRMYGGGQFELDVGRDHIQALASVFYPDSPNDVAPRGYNKPEPDNDLSGSPLAPPSSSKGMGWD